ncbi:hypothetical protein [Komagataeibacter europaeus]|uniref:hypothetical protein n=1 Tax=Komagataeibacter europaeus TaxID=33995 RepID=UPI0002E0B2E2|nr:hypothetical protein [Komagataeibacter europaeus]
MTRKFNTLDGFIRHLRERVQPNIEHAVHRGVQDGADLIKTETKVQIGHYLDGSEPGLPTAPLADRTIDDRIRKGFSPDEPGLRTGDMRESYGTRVSDAGLRVEASIGSDDIKAVVFELGRMEQNNYQPPRPELSVAAFRNEQKVARGIGRMVVRAIEGRILPNARAEDTE